MKVNKLKYECDEKACYRCYKYKLLFIGVLFNMFSLQTCKVTGQ